MPPSQWVKLRQYSSPRPSGSTSFKIVAPVVVKPEAVSKKASKKLGIAPLIRNGRAPNRETLSQARPTVTSPSRAKMSVFRGFCTNPKGMPAHRAAAMAAAKAKAEARSAQNAAISRAGSIKAASTVSTFPTMPLIIR